MRSNKPSGSRRRRAKKEREKEKLSKRSINTANDSKTSSGPEMSNCSSGPQLPNPGEPVAKRTRSGRSHSSPKRTKAKGGGRERKKKRQSKSKKSDGDATVPNQKRICTYRRKEIRMPIDNRLSCIICSTLLNGSFQFKYHLCFWSKYFMLSELLRSPACLFCNYPLPRENTVRRVQHARVHMHTPTLFQCFQCIMSFDTIGDLKDHTNLVHGYEHRCVTLCSTETFQSEQSLNEHCIQEHTFDLDGATYPVTCRECGDKFGLFNELLLHTHFEHHESLIHLVAGRKFVPSNALGESPKESGDSIEEVEMCCRNCGNCDGNARFCHQFFSCNKCSLNTRIQKFPSSKNNAGIHFVANGSAIKLELQAVDLRADNVFACSKYRRKTKGLPDNRLSCIVCSELLTGPLQLKYHLCFWSPYFTLPEVIDARICLFCNASLPQSNALRAQHTRRHLHTLTVFRCFQCLMSFDNIQALTEHSLTHGYQHGCITLCSSQMFQTVDSLNEHCISQHGFDLDGTVHPVTCSDCGEKFEMSQQLLLHMHFKHPQHLINLAAGREFLSTKALGESPEEREEREEEEEMSCRNCGNSDGNIQFSHLFFRCKQCSKSTRIKNWLIKMEEEGKRMEKLEEEDKKKSREDWKKLTEEKRKNKQEEKVKKRKENAANKKRKDKNQVIKATLCCRCCGNVDPEEMRITYRHFTCKLCSRVTGIRKLQHLIKAPGVGAGLKLVQRKNPEEDVLPTSSQTSPCPDEDGKEESENHDVPMSASELPLEGSYDCPSIYLLEMWKKKQEGKRQTEQEKKKMKEDAARKREKLINEVMKAKLCCRHCPNDDTEQMHIAFRSRYFICKMCRKVTRIGVDPSFIKAPRVGVGLLHFQKFQRNRIGYIKAPRVGVGLKVVQKLECRHPEDDVPLTGQMNTSPDEQEQPYESEKEEEEKNKEENWMKLAEEMRKKIEDEWKKQEETRKKREEHDDVMLPSEGSVELPPTNFLNKKGVDAKKRPQPTDVQISNGSSISTDDVTTQMERIRPAAIGDSIVSQNTQDDTMPILVPEVDAVHMPHSTRVGRLMMSDFGTVALKIKTEFDA